MTKRTPEPDPFNNPFGKVKLTGPQQPAAAPAPVVKKEKPVALDAEAAMFLEAMGQVAPVRQTRNRPPAEQPRLDPKKVASDEAESMTQLAELVAGDGPLKLQGAEGQAPGLDPQVMYSVPKDGTYLVRVFAFPSAPDTTIRFSGAETYIYRLTITTGGFLDHTIPLGIDTQTKIVEARGWNIPDDAKSLSIHDGTAFHPKLANSFRPKLELKSTTHLLAKPGDEVLVPFTGKKGQVLAIEAASRSLGLPVDLVIRVLDKEKKPLARAEPPKLHSDTALSFTPPADGDYAVAVTDLYSAGSARHAFLLRIAPPQPDYDLTVVADRFTISPGKSMEVPVKFNRKNGYAWPVEIAVEGLPPGVKWELKPTAKPDPNAGTIVLTAEKAGQSGPFQVIGRDQHDAAMRRVAQAPLPEFETSTADLWFTVSDNPMSPPPPKSKK